VLLTGDSMITRRVTRRLDPAMQRLVELVQSVDLAFTNLEVLPNDFRGHPVQESGGTHLAARSWVLDDLLDFGFTLFACANNHSLDYGIEGLLATIEELESRELVFAGIGRNLELARTPAYLEYRSGIAALLACAATFATGQQAAAQRPELPGRPGLNPLRVETTYEVTPAQLAALRDIAETLGLEQQRLERIQLGFAFPPSDPGVFPFLEARFRPAERPAVRTVPDRRDLDAILAWTRDARSRADLVIVSIHAHEQGATKEEPAEFLITFARSAIDNGADVVVGHGPHLLRGMELYRGKPIFYSLGNFIAQNELVELLPADAYERFRADPAMTPSQVFLQRNDNERKGFPADRRYWQTVVPICEFEGNELQHIALVPVSLGFGQPVSRRGQPGLADGDEAREILERFAALSRPFGTTIRIENDRGQVECSGRT
jgi:poly-gamma-glutamate synthesis protein (capsule biosynthesis protein)